MYKKYYLNEVSMLFKLVYYVKIKNRVLFFLNLNKKYFFYYN